MRKRAEIEKQLKEAEFEGTEVCKGTMRWVSIELLLDIRDLLMLRANKKR